MTRLPFRVWRSCESRLPPTRGGGNALAEDQARCRDAGAGRDEVGDRRTSRRRHATTRTCAIRGAGLLRIALPHLTQGKTDGPEANFMVRPHYPT